MEENSLSPPFVGAKKFAKRKKNRQGCRGLKARLQPATVHSIKRNKPIRMRGRHDYVIMCKA